jgi:hypothetical protein
MAAAGLGGGPAGGGGGGFYVPPLGRVGGPLGPAGPVWARKDELMTLKQQTQTVVPLSDVEVGKEYFIMFGYNANPLFWFKYSIATCVRDIGGPNHEKEFVGDIVDNGGNDPHLGVTFRINNSRHENIFQWPPPNDGTGGSREILRYEYNGGTGSTASRKKSRKLKRKNRKSRKNRR